MKSRRRITTPESCRMAPSRVLASKRIAHWETTAAPDFNAAYVGSGSKSEELNVSKPSPLSSTERTSITRAATSLMGQRRQFHRAQPNRGNRYVQPKATAPHLDSTRFGRVGGRSVSAGLHSEADARSDQAGRLHRAKSRPDDPPALVAGLRPLRSLHRLPCPARTGHWSRCQPVRLILPRSCDRH
jgi:hypothetical protein